MAYWKPMGDFDWIICHLSLLITLLQIWSFLPLSDFSGCRWQNQMVLHYMIIQPVLQILLRQVCKTVNFMSWQLKQMLVLLFCFFILL